MESIKTWVASLCSTTVYASDSTVDVAWEDYRDGTWEIYKKRSTDLGVTWGADERLTHGTTPYFYPSIVVVEPDIYMAWFGGNQLSYLHSDDGGAIWDPVYALTNPPARAAMPFLAVRDSILHVLWVDQRDGHGAIYYKRNFLGSTGTGESVPLTVRRRSLTATFIGSTGILPVHLKPGKGDCRLLNSSGQSVVRLKPGINDVGALAPGVYFMRESDNRTLTKVIITR